MLKQLFLNAMLDIQTPFYMYTNGDILYNRKLIQTVKHIKQLMDTKLIRNKLLIIGTRSNHIMTQYVSREGDIELLARQSRVFIKDAQDYFIVTRHTINWETFPEYLVGRSGYDNAIVDFSFRNEIELIDATNTITALHQSNVKGEYLWKYHNNQEHGWNAIFWAPIIRHPSTNESRYSTEFRNGEITLFDKLTNKSIVLESFPNNWMNFNMETMLDPSHNAHPNLGPVKLTIIVLAYNRPESLKRLLSSLQRVKFGKDRIDLKVILDTDLHNSYDVDCLKVLYQYKWIHGSFNIHKHKTHQGSLNQWLKAWQPSSNRERALILEDNMIVSRHFYTAIAREFVTHQDDVTGISLEPSFITYYKNKLTPRVFFNYTNRVLNLYRNSGAFIPSTSYWRDFLKWMKKIPKDLDTEFLKHAPAYRHRFHGYYTNWYEHEISVWFSYFSEFVQPLSTVYLGFLFWSVA
ncbi:hypothetical protein LOD99_14866 [Oopsacas minuta]|uniref:Uncharacterized protein n=1 Tax=Oopsacas minuta TaxID=111878 RepID=A0AAV7KD52_9METZ|nr:hypothetical protein LOD99_14866 [Oopsacas minuta]